MMETMLVMPIMLVIGFGIVHGGLVFQAQSNLEYAALMAARVGAASNIDINKMITEAEYRMRATTSVDGEDQAAIIDELSHFSITVLNPTVGIFDSCGRQPTYDPGNCFSLGICEIPYFGLQFYDRTNPSNDCNGVSIQDANILRIRVSYTYDSKIPFLNRIRFIGEPERPEAEGVEISAVATVRMQSPAHLTFENQPYFVDSGP